MKKKSFREKFVAASFFLALITFVLLKHYLKENDGYAWLAFLLVPLAPVMMGLKKITISYSLFITVLYLVLGFTMHWWHPGWVLFLTIPVFYIFFPKGINSFIKITTNDDDDEDDKDEDIEYKDI